MSGATMYVVKKGPAAESKIVAAWPDLADAKRFALASISRDSTYMKAYVYDRASKLLIGYAERTKGAQGVQWCDAPTPTFV